MNVFEANISLQVSDFLNSHLKSIESAEKANQTIYEIFGITHFFESDEDLHVLKDIISIPQNTFKEPDRAEYGDFQTNIELADKVASYLITTNCVPEIVIEPTCGKGSFIVASLKHFKGVRKIFGIEIYKPYIWETKFAIIEYYLNKPVDTKLEHNLPIISIIHSSVFDFDFRTIVKENKTNEILIVGNPPWVTNSKLGALNSSNLPKKSNFKNHNGLDAITGKGNFDIAEYITMMRIETFQFQKGNIALLVKNTVIKNIIFDQNVKKYAVSSFEKHCIDSKKEFNVSVEAALFFCRLNSKPTYTCTEFDFYNNLNPKLTFGWLADKFVSNLDTYSNAEQIDGKCPFEWRQGIKHDCSSIMEFDKLNGHFVNALKEEFQLEDALVYGILKSSDLKNTVTSVPRKYTIVTQKRVGQETNYIQYDYPETYKYLIERKDIFNLRKSSIYNNKPIFSIFGVGDYSFKPYKVAISGLYKTCRFTLILPEDGKPIMLDDTCYMLGFEKLEFAVYSLVLLNAETTTQLLQSITFSDAKRTFTKDVLMRIDLLKLAKIISKSEVQEALNELNEQYSFDLTLSLWDDFIQEMTPIKSGQFELFA